MILLNALKNTNSLARAVIETRINGKFPFIMLIYNLRRSRIGGRGGFLLPTSNENGYKKGKEKIRENTLT